MLPKSLKAAQLLRAEPEFQPGSKALSFEK